MKFGIALPNFGQYADKEHLSDITLQAEALGFDSIWVSDHIVIPNSHEGFGDEFYEPLITLSFLAAKTSSIKLGTSVIILPYRNPVTLAKMISTLDVLSEGRVILGIGAGWLEKEFEALGVSYKNRGRLTDEYLKAMKVLWTENNPEFKGEFLEFSDIKFLPKPYQKPHPPIWIGGGSAKARERAVELGDGWHPVGLTPPELRRHIAELKVLRNTIGKTLEDFPIIIRRNLEINSEKDFSEGETLRGTPEKIIRGIKEYKEAGASYLLFQVLGGDINSIQNTIQSFTEDIRPHI